MKPNQKIGQLAENFACCYLQRHGLRLLQRNYATRFGEIDLIMRRKSLLIFVEVRLRNHPHLVNGKESVDYFKQQRLIKAAQHYLQSQCNYSSILQLQSICYYQHTCRFDIMDLQNRGGSFKVDWIKNAFELTE